jgi:hypothetical protein
VNSPGHTDKIFAVWAGSSLICINRLWRFIPLHGVAVLTLRGVFAMSAYPQKQTCAVHQPMSALPPIATAKAKFRKSHEIIMCLGVISGELSVEGADFLACA